MNSCCCRSHSDRTNPMACLPQFPRLQRVQSCRPYLEGRKSASCCMSSERRWGQRNGEIVQLLAKVVDKSANSVRSFLHQLTLQLFARILYPLMAGWNTLKIPFVQPDTCELYYGIFDECGNLRWPMPIRTFLILITMMQYFLNLPTQKLCRGKNKCAYCKKKDDNIKHIHNPGYCGKDAITSFSRRGPTAKDPSPKSQVWAELRRLGYEKPGSHNSDLNTYPSDESIPYGYAPYRCPCQASERELSKAQSSRRGLPSPYANVQDPEALQNACEAELQSPMLASDCNESSAMTAISPQTAQLIHITRISNLYTAVVENRHSRQLLGDGRPPKQRIIPCTKQRFSGGFLMPQPYFNGMHWSWLHREPQRMVRLPSGGLPLQIPRYRRQLLDEEYQGFKSKYEDISRQVNPFKESSPSPFDNYSKENRFTPEKRLIEIDFESLPTEKTENLQFSIAHKGRQVPIEVSKKMEWKAHLLKRVNQARKLKGPLDYWRDMMDGYQLGRTFDQEGKDALSTLNLISPIKRKESSPISVKRNNNCLSSVKQKSENRGDSVSPQNKIMPISRKQENLNLSDSTEQTNIASEIKPRKTKNRSVDELLRSVNRDNLRSREQKYPDPEDYRREMARDHSKNRRYQRKTAGESILLIKTAESIGRMPGFIKLNETNQPLTDISCSGKPLLKKKSIECLDKKVRFRVQIPPSLEKVKPEEDMKPKIRRTFFLSGGGDQQYSKSHAEGSKTKTLSNDEDINIIYKPRKAKSLERIIRTIKFLSDDPPKQIVRHKTQAADANSRKTSQGNSKSKAHKFIERCYGMRSKLINLTELETLNNKHNRRKPVTSML
ncbi:uncharacterized protein LOC128262939 [Drosophila gunungcola]|uniref:uncharacterized protein LOC128262939 n=1 Tax=Drosophila gunungcola TaxID=103775 RepID=UPI0022E41448|nr:uncharacterized protein LOC128262939 [Drosophila gunungcola]